MPKVLMLSKFRQLVWLLAVAALLTHGPRASFAQFDIGDLGLGNLSGSADASSDPVTFSSQFTAATADRPAVLMITAKMAPDWHIYSMTQPKGGPMRTKLTVNESPQYQVIGSFASMPEFESHIDQEVWVGLEIQEHHDEVTWYVPIELAEGVSPEVVTVTGKVSLQACKESCIPIKKEFVAKLGPGVPIGELNLASENGDSAIESPTSAKAEKLVPNLTTPGEPYDLGAIEFAQEDEEGTLARYLLLAFFGGLALNLMPCVLPVIGLKVMSFVQQAGHSRGQAFALNAWYSLGIVAVFWVLAVFAISAGLSWGEQFSSPVFNIIMASIVFLMALSLLGVWEIPIPGFLGSGTTQQLAQREGPAGAFLKGVITTILATPCTGPGMAVALGWAVRQPPLLTFTVFTVLGLGMASPYLLIGAFPGLVSFLPKPGAWMETFKQLMGFVLIGSVLFLLTIMPSHFILPTLALLTCLALACWLYAKTPVTASDFDKTQTVALSATIIVAGAVFAFGWLHPLLNADGENGSWQPFSLARLNQVAVEERKTVLVDFGADWCTNCQVLEQTVLHTDQVEHAIKQNNVVTMFADNTETPPEIEKTIRALRCNGVPVIAIFPGNDPYRPIVFSGLYTKADLVGAIEEAKNRLPNSVARTNTPAPTPR